MIRTPQASAPLIALFGMLLLSACEDAPTMPDAIQRVAGGEEWVAMSVPSDLPQLDVWVAHISRSTEAGRDAYARVRELEGLSRDARGDGHLEAANHLHREAERTAVLALDRAPDAILLQRALHAIDFWGDRVRAIGELERFPDLAHTESAVRDGRAVAAALLAEGDTTSAVLRIVELSELIRYHSPDAVALRVIGRAEALVDPASLGPSAAERAFQLLANARTELIDGDPRRALRRALYALQIVEGSEVRVISTAAESVCSESPC